MLSTLPPKGYYSQTRRNTEGLFVLKDLGNYPPHKECEEQGEFHEQGLT